MQIREAYAVCISDMLIGYAIQYADVHIGNGEVIHMFDVRMGYFFWVCRIAIYIFIYTYLLGMARSQFSNAVTVYVKRKF